MILPYFLHFCDYPSFEEDLDLHSHHAKYVCTKFDCNWPAGWLIDYLRFYVPLKNISLIWRRHHCRWRAAKFRPMLGAQGLWAGRDLYCATPAVTRYLGFSGLIQRTAPFSRLIRHTRGCGGSTLTRILTGPHSVAFYDTQGGWRTYSNPDPHGDGLLVLEKIFFKF
jgi:hypothetical protein